MGALHRKWGVTLDDYSALYGFSIEQPEKFWASVWEFCDVIAERRGNVVVQDFGTLPGARFDHTAGEGVTCLRLTPKYIETVSKAGLEPARSHDLSRLKCITVGGAPFGPAGYEYVYTKIKADVQLASPAGGTDPLGALVTGNPIAPVWPGEIQCRGLGLKMGVFSEDAKPLVAVRAALHGWEITNRHALINPEALLLFEPERLGIVNGSTRIRVGHFPGCWPGAKL